MEISLRKIAIIVTLPLAVIACDSSINDQNSTRYPLQETHSNHNPVKTATATAFATGSDTAISTAESSSTAITESSTGTQESITHWDFTRDTDISPFSVHTHESVTSSDLPFESGYTTVNALAVSSWSAGTSSDHGSISGTSDISIDLSSGSDLTGSTAPDMEFCVQVGDIVEFGVAGRVYDPDTGFTINNLSAYSRIHHWDHPNVQLISQSDEGISVMLLEEDIVDLNIQYENDINQVFISAVNNGGSRPLLLRKRFHYDTCGFSLYTSTDCGFMTSGPDQASMNVNGTSITTVGCEILQNPDNVPVLEVD